MIRRITDIIFYSSRQRTWKWTKSFPIYFDEESTVDYAQRLSVWIYNTFDQHREKTAFMLWESGKFLSRGGAECRCGVCGVWRSQHLRGWAFNTRTPLSIERGVESSCQRWSTSPRPWGCKGENISEQFGKFPVTVWALIHTHLVPRTL